MVEDILSKLNAELHHEITSERQVVYILVQTRKLIEGREPAKDFEALRLHCDWVLHPKLDRASAKKLLVMLNDHYAKLLNKHQPQEALNELGEKLGLKAFQAEFRRFFKLYDLNDSQCDGAWWFDFLQYYSRVIQDCPLEGTEDSAMHFDRVVLVDPEFTSNPTRLYMQWEFQLKEQQVGLWITHRDRASLEAILPLR